MFINESCIYETIRSQSLLMQNGRNVVRFNVTENMSDFGSKRADMLR